MSVKTVVDIDFYRPSTMSYVIRAEAQKQGFDLDEDVLIAVKTLLSPLPSFVFEKVRSTFDDVIQYMKKLAREDGVDIDEVMRTSFKQL